MEAFRERVETWRTEVQIPEFHPLMGEEVYPAGPVNPSKPLGYRSGHGVTEGQRYQREAKFEEMYSAIIPQNRSLARELADQDEREIFHSSNHSGQYENAFLAKFRILSLQVEFANFSV
jgi:hypothetical protein